MDEPALNRVNGDRLQSRQDDGLIGLARGLWASAATCSEISLRDAFRVTRQQLSPTR